MSYDHKSLSEGLKSIYYTPSSAVADIVDNSLDAKSKNIDIYFWNGNPTYVAIIDDGCGMTNSDLENAIKIQKNASKQSNESLGKFGWGLKTASFSQCKYLTILTKKNNLLSSVCLDSSLKKIDVTPENIFAKFKTLSRQFYNRVKENGTAIVWSDLNNQILGKDILKNSKREHAIFYQVGVKIAEYSSICFHNFLDNVNIYFNENLINKQNPFFFVEGCKKYQSKEIILPGNRSVILEGILYPREEDMDDRLYELIGGMDGWFDSQGIYIYREGRLIDFGGWFNLSINGAFPWKKEEKYKRVRVSIKYKSSLDDVFLPNVQKSRGVIPTFLRRQIAQYCDAIRKDCLLRPRSKGINQASNVITNEIIKETIFKKNNNKIYIDYQHPLVDEFLNKQMAKTKKELFLEKILNELIENQKQNQSFFRKIFK